LKKVGLVLILLVAVVAAATPFYLKWLEVTERPQLKSFASYEELKSFVRASLQTTYEGRGGWLDFFGTPRPMALNEAAVPTRAVPSYSTTNVQVEGVDEADVVKTDGEYIYVVSDNIVFIVKAYPPEGAKILSRIKLNGTVMGIFVNQDKLAVFEGGGSGFYEPSQTYIKVYDMSDRGSRVLKRNLSLDGWYFNSRMIGDYVYGMINSPATLVEDEVPLPKIGLGGRAQEIHASEVHYSDIPDYFYMFTTIVAVNIQNDGEEPTHKTLLLGATSSMYVSLDNIYITVPKWMTSKLEATGTVVGKIARGISSIISTNGESTVIYRVHVKADRITCDASGEVPGIVLNQFSMDEHNGYFRVATTTGQVARSLGEATSRNHVYVLDMNLNVVGKLEDLAPGETIYSARFLGDRCYLVTFRKVDPLFVIDLKNPDNPEVLGKLKITGYSDYLHPYDENHIIGIGKETVAAEEGDFAWYQGVKMSLFDVSDVEKPKEIAKYEIGDRGTDSPVLRDHKALLFDGSKKLLVMPVLVAEIDKDKYPNGVPPNTHGEYVWQGAYVFNISLDEGLVLKGGITHLENSTDMVKSGYYFSSPYSVKRSLYIGDVLYTVSDKKIQMNSLENLHQINEVKFL